MGLDDRYPGIFPRSIGWLWKRGMNMKKVWLVLGFLFIAPALTHAQSVRLMTAASSGDANELQTLLDAGADVNATGDDGETALMAAATRGHSEAAQTLLDAGADVNASADNGETALMYAALRGHPDTVQALLDAGANVDARDINGETALMHALCANVGETPA